MHLQVSEAQVPRSTFNRSSIIVPAGSNRDEGWAAFRNALVEIHEASLALPPHPAMQAGAALGAVAGPGAGVPLAPGVAGGGAAAAGAPGIPQVRHGPRTCMCLCQLPSCSFRVLAERLCLAPAGGGVCLQLRPASLHFFALRPSKVGPEWRAWCAALDRVEWGRRFTRTARWEQGLWTRAVRGQWGHNWVVSASAGQGRRATALWRGLAARLRRV